MKDPTPSPGPEHSRDVDDDSAPPELRARASPGGPIPCGLVTAAPSETDLGGPLSFSVTKVSPSRFFGRLFGDEAPGHLILWTRQNKRSHCFEASDLEGAAERAEELARKYDVYVGVGLQGEAVPGKERGRGETVVAVPGLWLDLDIAGDDHAKKHLPPDIPTALSLIAQFPLKPTIIVDTGHGLHLWWLFQELYLVRTDQDRARIQSLSRRFQATINSLAGRRGWQFDNTSDLARILRIPGTVNRKSNPLPVRVLEVIWP